MKGARILLCGIGLVAGLGWDVSIARAEEPYRPYRSAHIDSGSRAERDGWPVALDGLAREWRDTISRVTQQPTLTALSPADKFPINAELYRWMLDHPDRVALAWRRLRVPAVEITPQEWGRFSWRDENGSELVWRTVARGDGGRIWYAEGKVKPGPFMPLIPVRVVAVLWHDVERDANGRTTVHHQLEAYLQTDSKFANLVTRLLGPAAPKMAEQGAEQLLYFFSGVARHVDEHPEKAPRLLAGKK